MYRLYCKNDFENHLLFNHNEKKIVTNDGLTIHLTSPESTLLDTLCESRIYGQEYADRNELENKIWPDSITVDRSSNLNQVACTLRKKMAIMGDNKIIRTAPKKGYFLDVRLYRTDTVIIKNKNKNKNKLSYISFLTFSIFLFFVFYHEVICISVNISKIPLLLYELFIVAF